jgi:glutamate 5-kinase
MSLEIRQRQEFARARRWVIKIGSALLTNEGRGLDGDMIARLVAQIAQLRGAGKDVVLVSSGAVAAGMLRLGWSQRPHGIHELQAAAAVGQMGLVQSYESAFQEYGMHTAQVLLDHDDISARDRYLNARATLTTLLGLGVVPVVNENDTVVTDEIRFGDNDTLAALVANLVDADALLILTDQEGLYDADPRNNPDAKLVSDSPSDAPELEAMAGSSGALGRGGMVTKIRAARLAARSGTDTLIASGRRDAVITGLAAGEDIGTWLRAGRAPENARKQWLAGLSQCNGTLVLDNGAVNVLRDAGKSLLPVGVKAVRGDFARGDLVSCVDEGGTEIARGLVNYARSEAQKIIGHASDRIESLLGYQGEAELIHRDNLVLS